MERTKKRTNENHPFYRNGICQGCSGYPMILERVWPGIDRWRCGKCVSRERFDYGLYQSIVNPEPTR